MRRSLDTVASVLALTSMGYSHPEFLSPEGESCPIHWCQEPLPWSEPSVFFWGGGGVDIGFTKKESDRHGNPANENSIQSFSEPRSCRVAGRGTSVTKNVYTSMCPNTPNSSSSLRDLDRTSSSSSMRTSSLSRRLSPRVKLSGALLKLFRKGDSPSGA